MKKITILLLAISFGLSAFAWDEPVFLTDSLANNYEPVICYIDFYEGPSHYMFWVRETDSAYNAIYARNMYSESEPVLVTELDTCTYRNPQIIPLPDYSGYDHKFILLWESNLSGTFNINYKIHDADGFSETYLLEESDFGQNHMECNYNGDLVWEENGEIHFAKLNQDILNFTESVILDENGCSQPVIVTRTDWQNDVTIAWIKGMISNESKAVYYIQYDYSGVWSDIIYVHESFDINNLAMTNNEFVNHPGLFFWDNIDIDGESTIYAYDIEYQGFFISEFSREGLFSPYAFTSYIPVKDGYYDQTFLAFSYSLDSTDKMYSSWDNYLSPSLQNFFSVSEDMGYCNNSSFYLGKPTPGYLFNDLFLVWETTNNDITQIASAKTIVGGSGIEEISNVISEILISPNPIKNKFNICFTTQTSFETYFELATLDGKTIGNKLEIETNSGENNMSLFLSGFNIIPDNGIYLLKIKTGNGYLAKKIVIAK